MSKFLITINGETFTTKTSLGKRCKSILNSYKDGDRLTVSDEGFMIDFFTQLAKSYKLNGMSIIAVFVRKSKMNPKNLQFWIKREDGTETDISYPKCITPPTKIDEIQSACRNAIYEIKNKYKISQTYPIKSALSNTIIQNADEAEVDHYDMNFVDLVHNWIQENGGIDYIYSKINETMDGEETTEFTNPNLKESFIKYHNTHTHLRIITLTENRQRKKSKRVNIK